MRGRIGLSIVMVAVIAAGVVAWRRHHLSDARGEVTFARDVGPIVYEHCAGCHRAGGVGPFELVTYEDVRKRARQVAGVTGKRLMPPWPPDAACGPFVGQRGLSDAQIEVIDRWVKGGALAGDWASMPKVPAVGSDWALGTPDLVLTPSEPYMLAADGKDVYQNFVLPIAGDATRYVRAVELRPGNARVVHHVSLLIDRYGMGRRKGTTSYRGMDAGDDVQPVSGQLLFWQPGKDACLRSEDQPWALPAGADVVLQAHLKPSGKPETVRMALGVYFTDRRPTNPMFSLVLRSTAIDIPAGAADYAVESSYVLPVDAEAVTVNVHAHYLGKDLQGYAVLPDGTRRTLLRIPEWDFNWQGTYTFVTPVALPRGTRLGMRHTYDNTEGNTNNPSRPPRRVRFGPNTADEMGEFWVLLRVRGPVEYAALAADYQAKYLTPDTVAELRGRLREEPTSAEVHADLAAALLLPGGDVGQAAAEARAAVAIKSDCGKAHRCLGAIAMRTNDTARAAAEYRLAVAADPNDYASRADLGLVLGIQGDLPGAVEALRESIRVNPNDPLTHTNLGRVYAVQGKVAEAREELRRSLKLDPEERLAVETLRVLGGSR